MILKSYLKLNITQLPARKTHWHLINTNILILGIEIPKLLAAERESQKYHYILFCSYTLPNHPLLGIITVKEVGYMPVSGPNTHNLDCVVWGLQIKVIMRMSGKKTTLMQATGRDWEDAEQWVVHLAEATLIPTHLLIPMSPSYLLIPFASYTSF